MIDAALKAVDEVMRPIEQSQWRSRSTLERVRFRRYVDPGISLSEVTLVRQVRSPSAQTPSRCCGAGLRVRALCAITCHGAVSASMPDPFGLSTGDYATFNFLPYSRGQPKFWRTYETSTYANKFTAISQ
jgi:hypothetical protein